MEHYLFVMWDGGGAVPPILGVAGKLLAEGKKVSVLGETSLQAEAEAAGCQFHPYQYAPNRTDRRPESDPFPDWKGDSPFKVLHKLLYTYAAAYAKDVFELCQRQDYQKVIVDGFLPGGMIGAEAAGKPFVAIWPALDPIPHPGRPPDGLGLLPGKTLWGQTRNAALNWVFKKMLRSGRKIINPLREQYGLPALNHPFEQYRQAEKVIILSSPSFDFPVQLPSNTVFGSPQVNDPSWAPEFTLDIPGPYVLISLGSTFQNQHALYQKLMDTMQQLPVPVVVTLGDVFEPESFRTYPNIRLLKAAAHQEILPSCGLVIHHGGHGISMKSILAGLPQLVIPLGRDQFGNAARIVYHGIGLKAGTKTSSARLLKMAKTLLAREAFSRSAQLMATKIKAEMQQSIQDLL